MSQYLKWCLGGVFLGLIIHLSVIFTIPKVSPNDLWTRITALGPAQTMLTLEEVMPGAFNPLQLDPGLSHATCHLSLVDGPAAFYGELPASFWSIAVYDRSGTVLFSTTNRIGDGRLINIGVFNDAQVADLARQEYELDPNLLLIEATSNDVFFIVRAWPQTPVMRARINDTISGLFCGGLL